MASTYSTGKKSPFTIESMANWPWVSICFCLAIAWYILSKISNSATLLGAWLKKITNPSEYDKEQTLVDQVKSTLPKPVKGSGWTLEKNNIDANDIANALKTDKASDHWWKGFTENEDTAFEIVKNYTNAQQFQNLSKFYSTVATDSRNLKNDLVNLLDDNQVVYLKHKGII